MASITLGICSSHSPMLSTPVEEFPGHQERDRKNPTIPNYEELLESRGEELAPQLTPEVAAERHDRNQAAVQRLHEILVESRIDAMIIVGDDQAEWFEKDAMPALAIYWNDWVESRPPPKTRMHPTLQSGYWGHYGDGSNQRYPVASDIGESLVKGLTARGFDIHSMRKQPDDEHLGHAWGFMYQRVMQHNIVPIVPIMLNTYFPPNQPTALRCWQLGNAIRDIVAALPDDRRIGIAGSGGLSHFLVDERFDRVLLDMLAHNDEASIAALSEASMQSGTSEARNWIVAGGAASHLKMEVIDYVPFYRSLAGSGIGMGFAVWR